MDYNGKLLARARERLARLREENAAEQRRRTAEAYARLPRLRELDRELRMQMIELARLAMDRSAAAKERLASLRDENLALQAERAELLVSAGFPADYTDEIYSCPDCHDTGIKGTGICHCLKKLYKRELTDELSTLLHGGQESFERFGGNRRASACRSSATPAGSTPKTSARARRTSSSWAAPASARPISRPA